MISLGSTIIEIILFSLLVTLGVSWISIRIAVHLGLIDVPGSAPHKVHTKPTPLAGGIALALVLTIFAANYGTLADPEIRAIFLSSLAVFLVGLWDDIREIPPWMKLVGQAGAVMVLIGLGVYVRIFESPEFFVHGEGGIYVYLDWLLTAFWMIGITNAFNFVDSMDGLATSLAGIAAAFFTLVTIESNQAALARQNALLLGTCIGLYFFNAPPARLFLGDAAAQTLGFILAALAIVYTPTETFQTTSWFVPIMIIGVPIFDTTLVVISRLRRGRPVYQAARDHTYHRLVAFGLDPNHAILTMQIPALLLGSLAFLVLSLPPLQANTIFIACLGVSALAIAYLDSKNRWP